MRPLLLCNPAAKAHPVGTPASAIMHREHHLVCYAVRVVEDVTRTALIRNQFEPNGDALAATESTMLCAPSRKQVVNSALGPAERESPGERE
jgi:hypothetical protein